MKTVFFDLDGTLTDSAPGITNSVAYALEKMGRPPLPRAELAYFIGPALTEAFAEKFGWDEATSLAVRDVPSLERLLLSL